LESTLQRAVPVRPTEVSPLLVRTRRLASFSALHVIPSCFFDGWIKGRLLVIVEPLLPEGVRPPE